MDHFFLVQGFHWRVRRTRSTSLTFSFVTNNQTQTVWQIHRHRHRALDDDSDDGGDASETIYTPWVICYPAFRFSTPLSLMMLGRISGRRTNSFRTDSWGLWLSWMAASSQAARDVQFSAPESTKLIQPHRFRRSLFTELQVQQSLVLFLVVSLHFSSHTVFRLLLRWFQHTTQIFSEEIFTSCFSCFMKIFSFLCLVFSTRFIVSASVFHRRMSKELPYITTSHYQG